MATLHEPSLKVRDVISKTGLSESTIRRAITRGEIKIFRFGRAVRVDHRDVDEWLESKRDRRVA